MRAREGDNGRRTNEHGREDILIVVSECGGNRSVHVCVVWPTDAAVPPAAGDGGATPVAAIVGVAEAVMDEEVSEDPCAASIAKGELRAGADTGVDDEGEKPDEADRGDAEVEEVAAAATGRSAAEAARIKPVAAVFAGCSGT
jgi:hypothetical protein